MDAINNITLPWPEPERPKYRAGKYQHWTCDPTPLLTKPTTGYFRLHATQEPGWMIRKSGTIWMSLAAMERESHMPHIAAARGHVVVAGLGMGFVAYNLARKPEVTKVTVVERDKRVIALMDRISDWRSWPKVELVVADALTWKPAEPVDFLYSDIWDKLGDEKGLGLTRAIQANVGAARVGSWGQEIDFLDWCRDSHTSALDVADRHYRAFVTDSGLPLIGAEWPGYARLACAAAVMQTLNPRLLLDLSDYRWLLSIYHGLVADRTAA